MTNRPMNTWPIDGHALMNEGAPFTSRKCESWPCDKIAGVQRVGRTGELSWFGVGGHGHALCECGKQSEHVLSGAKRRSWHKEHKGQVRTARS